MLKPLLCVIAIGATFGFMLPGKSDEPAKAAHPATEIAKETLLERSDGGHFYVHAKINGELVRAVVDTGASNVALTVKDAERLNIPFSPSEFVVVGTGASGPVRGKLISLKSVSIDGKNVSDVPGAILEGLEITLLGQTYLSRISGVEMNGDYMTLR